MKSSWFTTQFQLRESASRVQLIDLSSLTLATKHVDGMDETTEVVSCAHTWRQTKMIPTVSFSGQASSICYNLGNTNDGKL